MKAKRKVWHLTGSASVRDAAVRPYPTGTPSRHAFTLVELLVVMAVTLILILAMSQVFVFVGERVAEGRAIIEMAGNMRTVANRMQADLDGVTVSVLPWTPADAGQGYFEYLEGIGSDSQPLPDPFLATPPTFPTPPDIYGDIDDVLAFTATSNDAPFRGTHYGVAYASNTAEIVWFTRFEDRDGDRLPGPGELRLYRRVLLVLPDFVLNNPATSLTALHDHFRNSDISARIAEDGSGIVANTLADLTNRRNRFGHDPSNFPYPLSRRFLVPRGTVLNLGTGNQPGFPTVDDDLNGTPDNPSEIGWFGSDDLAVDDLRAVDSGGNLFVVHGYGHDLLLPDILGFDVRLFDPAAAVRQPPPAPDPLIPGDPGWATGTTIGRGAFVDLNYANSPAAINDAYALGHSNRWSLFSGLPAFRDQNGNGIYDSGERYLGVPYVSTYGSEYCTWTWLYERDGVDQFGDSFIDTGTNGFDDNGLFGVDDPLERETSPPYPVPLRGVQVRIRAYEPDSRQVKQATVIADFVPE